MSTPYKLDFDQFLQIIAEAHNRRIELMKRKNHDYSDSSDRDLFANFNGSSVLDIEPEIGVLLRIQDKMMRVKTFVKHGKLMVVGEGVEDALDDIQNYIDLLRGMIFEKQRTNALESDLRRPADQDSEHREGERLLRCDLPRKRTR
jgi:hypothetical protein